MSFRTARLYWWQGLGIAIVSAIPLYANISVAQITPDGTLPNNSNVKLEGNTSIIEGGTTRGANLFHSFAEFSVLNGSTALFNNAPNIQNILTRVTGKSFSNIDGLIRANGTANLFLLNPNGIIFGANARLDIGGSFLATTASSFKWSDGSTFSATNPQPPSELLAINPSALFFNQLQTAKIENRSTTNAGNNLKGLRVPDGRSLLLVGGDIVLDGGSLNALGGLVELAGVSGNGIVGLNVDSQDLSLNIPNDVPRADISLSNGAVVDVRAGGGGSITVNARNLDLKQQSQLVAGIKSGLGTATATAGDIKVNATDTVVLNNSLVSSRVEENGEGKAGDVSITTGSLEVTNGALLSASTFGKGDAGSVNITARDTIKFDGKDSGAYSRVFYGAEGKAGGVLIKTGSLEVTNGALLSASNFGGKGNAGSVTISASDTIKFDGKGEGQGGFYSGAYSRVFYGAEGKAGGVLIKTGSLEVTNGARLDANTFAKGDAGIIDITATDTIKFDGEANDGSNSGAFSEVISGAEGNAGGVSITTGSLEITNGAVLSTSTDGKGNAGSVIITARDTIKFDGEANNGSDSGAYSRVNPKAEGKAGGVSITTGSLEVTNGALLSASTFGKGDAGSVNITASDTIKFDGEGKDKFNSGAYSRVVNSGTEGNAGGVLIKTGSLEVTNGARLDASTEGKGDAGSVSIIASDTIKFDGEGSKYGYLSGAFSEVKPGAKGNAGGISITTDSLEVTNGAQVSASTFGKGNAGSVSIIANTFEASNGSQVSTITSGESDAGNITFQIKDNITLSGLKTGLFANTSEGSIGNGGSIIIDPTIMTIRDGAAIAVDSQGEGIGGNIQLAADFLTLDRGTISAATRSNTGGDITLNLQKLLFLRDRSKITTTAGIEQFGGNGGNITINAPNGFIVAVPNENSDITANAFTGSGGRVDIQATGIYGIEFRESPTSLSDITASSEFGRQGTVELNTPDVDPNNGLVQLPITPVDTQVTQGCYSPDYAQNRFVITGRGGLPINPTEPLQDSSTLSGWVRLRPQPENLAHTTPVPQPTASTTPKIAATIPIVEASGWVIDNNGHIELVAQVPQLNPRSPWQTPADCSVSQGGVKYGKTSAAKASN
ncbi:MAG: filamentous hemagglutinin N-terminal domain-containing protein [Nostoc sp. CmiVER01]|uniref:two-partner secretion domain-containing protein n=1 Tax=Nostoc sp. CmiVER01 TaxID=3075384 RepID=UPI002AD4FFE5|nr:filamentous hemagglutinin N-terminal domain-containing protein [Nostoc sp. CmiVER01]MDZ8120915.1 filamentous hemagglutinin N-terminal domain-containing protein [Nostoc sp. CmiVER01]